MATDVVDTIELDETGWADERDAIVRRFLGLTAAEFVARYRDGEFDDGEPDGLMAVLAYFPELD